MSSRGPISEVEIDLGAYSTGRQWPLAMFYPSVACVKQPGIPPHLSLGEGGLYITSF